MSIENIRLSLVGERPILMHSSVLVDPLNPINQEIGRLTGKRFKTLADHEEISHLEFLGGLWLSEGRPCVPAEAIKACFIDAARTRRKGPHAKAGLFCNSASPLHYDGPSTPDDLWKDKRFWLRVPVTVNIGSRTMRTRARFPDWRVDVEAEFESGLLDRSEIVEIFRIAGFRIGLGDWRPEFGRFSVKLE